MTLPAPKADRRTAREIAAQVNELLPAYVKGWPVSGVAEGASEALVGIFARYCEIIIDRLNKVPDKNRLAFLDLMGVSPAAAQPARVPLTFYLNAKGGETLVPALTQVAALPARGEKDPVIFETERDLVLAPAILDSLFVRDEVRDFYADYTDLLDPAALPPPDHKISDAEYREQLELRIRGTAVSPDDVAAFVADTATDKRNRVLDELLAPGAPMFRGNRQFEHFLFVGLDPVSPAPVWKELRLKFVLQHDLPAPIAGTLQWRTWDGAAGVALTPASDSTQNMRSGEVVFANIPAPPVTVVNSRPGRWLRLSWAPPTNAPAGPLPVIQELTATILTEQIAGRPERAFLNNLPLDVSKDFFPLGEKPRFAETLYLASAAFSGSGAAVTLKVQLTNAMSAGANAPVPPVKPNAPKLAWEFWNGMEWAQLGISEFTGTAPSRLRIDPQNMASMPAGTVVDTTQALVESGQVSFRFASAPAPVAVAGQMGYWIRVRLISGDYGHEARYEEEPGKGYVVKPATFAPPVIHSLQVEQSLAQALHPVMVAYNGFTWREAGAGPFAPLTLTGETQPCCYLGLQPMSGRFPGRSMSFYFGIANPASIDTAASARDGDAGRVTAIWEYWNGSAWIARTVQDDTGGLRRSGLIRFLAPPDFSSKAEFGRERFWLRARKVERAEIEPRLRRVLLNTAMATQTQTTLNEVLGSGTGTPNQDFSTARKPVLEGQVLEVLEPSLPSSREREQIEREEGADAIKETPPSPEGRVQAWVRWHEMPDFECSGPRDRHYVVNRETGQILFGDGVAGLAPPAVTGNVRMVVYRTGGGAAGNKPAGSIVQLKTTVPYVERVFNFEAADGGADAETVDALLERAPREIRHGGRAVTKEDFEDLTKRASSEVARALCLPLRDLEAEMKDAASSKRVPGVISLILAPRWSADQVKPQAPSAELFSRVREYLDARRLCSVKLVLAAPDYVRLDVKAEISVRSADSSSQVELAVTLALKSFLHPLLGFKGEGWDFGRLPARSDLYALMESVPGVEHVRSLETKLTGNPENAVARGRFLVYAGDIQVAATLER